MSPLRQAALFLLCVTLYASPAFAATSTKEKSLGVYGVWHAYSYNESGQTVCYMVTTKTLTSSGPKKRSAPYLMITHRPTEASIDVISYGAGTLLNTKRDVKITIGKSTFNFFSVRDTAWARDSQTDHRVAAAIKNATVAQAGGVADVKGTKTIGDKFDLTGAALAYHAIGKACGLPDETLKKPTIKKKAAVTKKT